MTDWPGIITALGLFIVACANAWIIFQGHNRDKKVDAVVQAVDAVAIKTEETHKLVNGSSEAIKQAKEDIGFLKGMQAGKESERANPMISASGLTVEEYKAMLAKQVIAIQEQIAAFDATPSKKK